MKNSEKRKEIIEYSIKLNTTNLSPLRSGNISVRSIENSVEGFLITPSGKKYDTLKEEDIVFVSSDGNHDTNLKPSSEWRFHKDIYLKKPDAKAIVHAHSPHATAVSAHSKDIPAFHYMIALAGGDSIKCAKYATFGTQELSNNIIDALKNRKACLMSNHGQVAFGENLESAFELAEELENICHQYVNTIKLGNPKILSSSEMDVILEKVKNYKKG
ncbi:class II aldolase/adducin family protein [Candidatus Pelagibacter communis]|uniref:class II aldolase/adducin family protein n=1 Tax=Pelagibacter ubique TaxID=198252 RepID=UPI00094DB1C1|nr:class II aldolase/adducin family protein [Candidatus Pelagibacter ubique]